MRAATTAQARTNPDTAPLTDLSSVAASFRELRGEADRAFQEDAEGASRLLAKSIQRQYPSLFSYPTAELEKLLSRYRNSMLPYITTKLRELAQTAGASTTLSIRVSSTGFKDDELSDQFSAGAIKSLGHLIRLDQRKRGKLNVSDRFGMLAQALLEEERWPQIIRDGAENIGARLLKEELSPGWAAQNLPRKLVFLPKEYHAPPAPKKCRYPDNTWTFSLQGLKPIGILFVLADIGLACKKAGFDVKLNAPVKWEPYSEYDQSGSYWYYEDQSLEISFRPDPA